MDQRLNISSGTKWEDIVGYSRAVRVGNVVSVAGTTAVDDQGQVVAPGDPCEQARFVFRKIEKALVAAGATLQDVISVRSFVTDISRWEDVGRAHAEVLRAVRPTSPMVQVSALIQPELVVEIEVLAVIAGQLST